MQCKAPWHEFSALNERSWYWATFYAPKRKVLIEAEKLRLAGIKSRKQNYKYSAHRTPRFPVGRQEPLAVQAGAEGANHTSEST